jgi:LysM repeat protein
LGDNPHRLFRKKINELYHGGKMEHKGPSNFIAEHTVKKDETLSHIALKYYGSAVKEKWMLIYEANKDIIGPNPSVIKPGMVLKIPSLEPVSKAAPEEAPQESAKRAGDLPDRKKMDMQ